MTVTETYPSYFLMHNPESRVIISSYGDELAQEFGRKNRNKVLEYGPVLHGVTIAKDKGTIRAWDIAGHGGGLVSSGIGGTLTGKGSDLLIIDDPCKNMAEANSETYRDRVYDEYQSTLRTRVHAGGNIIIILTRWHEDDLAGRLLREETNDWEVISLPALCESGDDLLGRATGATLWPDGGYDEDWATRTKREVGARVWASLYQQRPAPQEGNIIKRTWWQFYTRLPDRFDEIIQSWDLTFKETKEGSYVVGQVWGKKGAQTYLIDQWRERADFTGTQKAIVSMTAKYPKAGRKYIEEAANGAAIISSLKQAIGGIVPVKPTGSKEARVHAVTPYIEAGNVFLPSPDICAWVGDFIEECTSFPAGQNDDQADCMAQALGQLYRPNAISVFR